MKINRKLLCCAVILLIFSIPFTYSLADHPNDIYWAEGFPVCGIDERVCALTIYNGKLIAGGIFEAAGDKVTHDLAAWDGNTWTPLAVHFEQEYYPDPRVYALAVYNGDLIVGGLFDSVDGLPVNNIAAWNGSEWDSLGAGVSGNVYALAVYDNQLIVGGWFYEAGGLAVKGVVSWNGSEWDSLGTGVNAVVRAFAEYDGKLVVSGVGEAGGMSLNNIASWNGSEWDSLGSGTSDRIFALTVYDSQLIAGGEFSTIGGSPASHIASWDGANWTPVGSGTDRDVYALSVFDGHLIAMGVFNSAGGVPAKYIAAWDGASWDSLDTGLDYSTSAAALINYDGKLIAGGSFSHAGGVPAKHIAAWNGSSWSSLGSGWGGQIFALTPYFNLLVAGGSFDSIGGVAANNIAAWNGSSWISLGSGVNGKVNSLTVCNYKLIAGGDFTSAGGMPANFVATWDYASWSALEGGFPPTAEVTALGCFNNKVIAGSTNGWVRAWNDGGPYWEQIGSIDPVWDTWRDIADFTVYDDCLIMGGTFSRVNAVDAYCIAAWNGSEWLDIGSAHFWTKALGVYDNKLYVGAGEGWLRCWDGVTWSTVGSWSGDFNQVLAFTVFNNELIVAGGILPEEGGPGRNIAAWNGTNWGCLGSGINRSVDALAVYDDKLYAGGRYFSIAGGKVSAYFAEWTKSDPVVGLSSPDIKSSALTLYQNAPNPFNPSTRITFILPEQSRATLSIFNIEGKLVRNLLDEVCSEGHNQVTWDGKNAQGNPVSSGVYFYRLKTGGKVLTKKMVLLK